jgi:hypothetical protein
MSDAWPRGRHRSLSRHRQRRIDALLVAAVTSGSGAERFAEARRSGSALDRAELLDYANAR